MSDLKDPIVGESLREVLQGEAFNTTHYFIREELGIAYEYPLTWELSTPSFTKKEVEHVREVDIAIEKYMDNVSLETLDDTRQLGLDEFDLNEEQEELFRAWLIKEIESFRPFVRHQELLGVNLQSVSIFILLRDYTLARAWKEDYKVE